jgi:hypothetical protein
MLASNRSLLNREQTLKKCSEGLGFDCFNVYSPCNLSVKDCTEIFYTINKWDVPSVQCTTRLRGSIPAREVDRLSLVFIDSDVTVLTP